MDEKGAKPDGSWPTFQYSEEANARRVLGTIANRLRRIEESPRRMEWDKPPISLPDYVARLRTRKQQLSRTILDAERTRPKTGRPGPLFQARPTQTMAPLPIDGGRRFELSSRELQVASEGWRELAGECRTYEGRVAPVTWWAEESKKYVTHDSECGAYVQYGYPDETFFRGTGYMEIYQHLYDDASIWRDDTPDSYRVDFAVGWELPRPNCDVLITCTIDVVHHVNFTKVLMTAGTSPRPYRWFTATKKGSSAPTASSTFNRFFSAVLAARTSRRAATTPVRSLRYRSDSGCPRTQSQGSAWVTTSSSAPRTAL